MKKELLMNNLINKYSNLEEIISKLISFKTISEHENLSMLNYIASYLKMFDIKSKIVAKEKNRANLYALIGPKKSGGIMLSGHTDVVPIEGQKWNSNPFKLKKKENKYFGRGTADMKTFIGIILHLIPELTKYNLVKPIHLMFSFDEEIGCVGIQKAIPFLKKLKYKPKSCIVGEPTEMKIIHKHKGKKNFLVKFNGVEAHSSQIKSGSNAILYASEFVSFLNVIQKELETKKNKDFIPPYATINVGKINGGIALNIIPKSCELEFEIRDLPKTDSEKIIKKIKKFLFNNIEKKMKLENKNCSVEFSITNNFPPLITDEKKSIINLCLNLLETNKVGTVSFGTEAGVFNNVDIETIVCGPGSINQAHQPDEFIEIEQIKKCIIFLEKVFKSLC